MVMGEALGRCDSCQEVAVLREVCQVIESCVS